MNTRSHYIYYVMIEINYLMRGIGILTSAIFSKLTFVSVLVMLTGAPVCGLHMTEMPKDLMTTVVEPQNRKISLKLPLRQPMFQHAGQILY